jgi:predicted nucleic acid-binding protein
MIVVDGTTVVNGLLKDRQSRLYLRGNELAVPHLIDSEIVAALSRLVRRGEIHPESAKRALDQWVVYGAQRHPMQVLIPRMWELRDHVKAPNAAYVALAERLGVPLVTCDKPLAYVSGVQCLVILLED